MSTLVIFATVFGPAYCRADQIVYVSSPFSKGKNPVARAIGLSSGHQIYALDNDFNRQKLDELGLLPPLAEIQEAMKHCGKDPEPEVKPKLKRQKKAPA